MTFNVYEDAKRAEAYAKLGFPGTYYLAYRDLPMIISKHVSGKTAFDFGCGTGRSTRFLRQIGFKAVGVDVSAQMVQKARDIEPQGDYRIIENGDFSEFQKHHYDLVLAAFTFDNIPTRQERVNLLSGLKQLLKPAGKMLILGSTPEIYLHEWASFSTRAFAENKSARSGDKVKIIMTDVEDKRPVEDFIWFDADYQEIFKGAKLQLVDTYRPLARQDEPYPWVNETRIAPWVIYVLQLPASQY
jgi:SAM-dependent methyltransferase